MNLSALEREIKAVSLPAKSVERIESAITFIKRSLLAVNVTSQTLVAFAQKPTDWVPRHDVQRLSLVMLVRERLKEFGPLLYTGIRLVPHFSPEADSFIISIDITAQTRVRIAIDNIIHNAIKYSKPNGIVDVTLERGNSAALLIIQDAGRGIADEDLPRIFEPGFSRRAPGHPQGTGMGLTTVKQILDGLGWLIQVSSKSAIGTTFTITIPLGEDRDVDDNSGC
jgi:signal transduction histidine kinase